MNRLQFLAEEIGSVRVALKESLRRDYGPGRGERFFDELSDRLNAIEAEVRAQPGDPSDTAHFFRTLYAASRRVALIERSYLGEFSWPFAEAVRDFAERLFVNDEASGKSVPIIHVVAEGVGYQILDDEAETPFVHRIMIIAFPRQLRHHVLLHAIFGHELGHPATRSDSTSGVVFKEVLPTLRAGPLGGEDAMRAWLSRSECPPSVRTGHQRFSDEQLRDWRIEVFCDLFGLLLFGPAFACAHRAILEPLHSPQETDDFEGATHPPYVVRRRLVGDAIRLLGWSTPVLSPQGATDPAHAAETAMLRYASEELPADWTRMMDDDELGGMLATIRKMFDHEADIPFRQPTGPHLRELLGRLAKCRPPIVQHIDSDGAPRNEPVSIQECLYAGWAFWFGHEDFRKTLPEPSPGEFDERPVFDFLSINRLCEQALWQQVAIDRCRPGGAS